MDHGQGKRQVTGAQIVLVDGLSFSASGLSVTFAEIDKTIQAGKEIGLAGVGGKEFHVYVPWGRISYVQLTFAEEGEQ